MTCEVCNTNESTGSAIIQNTYYPCICSPCKQKFNVGQSVSTGAARWNRTIDIEDHVVDIAQPWGNDGKPNPVFIQAYPDKARTHFTEEQLRDAYR